MKPIVISFLIILMVSLSSCKKGGTFSKKHILEPAPEMYAEVTWDFTKATSGSDYWWSVPTPNKWDIKITITNIDNRSFCIVPDFLFMESSNAEIIAKGLCRFDHLEKRKACLPFTIDNMPEDSSGSVKRTIVFPAGNDYYTVIWTPASLQWMLNNHNMEWIPVSMGSNDTLATGRN